MDLAPSDTNLVSGEERYVYWTLIVGILVSGAPILRWMFGIQSANGCSNRTIVDAAVQHQIPIDSCNWCKDSNGILRANYDSRLY
jgi:hypothetical protein